MPGATKVRLGIEPLRSIAASTFTGSYQTCGAILANPAILTRFVNNTSKDVLVSSDGTSDYLILPSFSFLLIDIESNAQSGDYLAFPEQRQWYVKATAGTGTFYIESYYEF